MSDELIDVLDENGKLTGKAVMKSQAHKNGVWHSASHIWIYTSGGEILLQKRHHKKELYPGLWDIAAAGHIGSGETPDQAALRELEEELGIKERIANLKNIGIYRSHKDISGAGQLINNEFYHVYLYCFDGDISKLKLQDTEVEAIKLIPLDVFEKQINNPIHVKEYLVPHGDYFEFVFKAIKKELGRK